MMTAANAVKASRSLVPADLRMLQDSFVAPATGIVGGSPIGRTTSSSQASNSFGRSNEPIAYRRGPSSPGDSSMHYDNTNRGSLFKNNKKTETDPEFSGTININGAEYRLAGWTKVAKNSGSKFISLSVKPKAEKPDKPAKPFNDEVGF
jgi:hypothetical protein